MFNRSPRIQKYLQKEVVEIPAPADLPTRPTIDWFMVGLPVLGIGAAIGLSIWLARGETSLGISSYLIFLPFTLATVLASVLTHFSQKRQYKERVEEIIVSYRQLLKEMRVGLQSKINQQKEILEFRNPDIPCCYKFAEQQSDRLGERRINDLDFLAIRIGTGTIPSYLEIIAPSPDKREKELIKFIELTNELKESYLRIEGAPVVADLKEIGCLGIAGDLNRSRTYTKSLLIHLTTHHWIEEVKASVFLGDTSDNWEFIKYLPHSMNSSGGEVNQLNIQQPEKDIGLKKLEIELRQRKEKLVSLKNIHSFESDHDWKNLLPILVVVFDNLPPDFAHAAVIKILNEGPSLGVFGIFISLEVNQIPGKCGGVINIRKDSIDYQETGEEKIPIESIVADDVQIPDAIQYAKNLQKIDWIYSSDLTNPPQKISLLNLFELENVEDIPFEQWWEEEYPEHLGHLKALVGKFSTTDNFILDLNDSDETINGHGPHGFIGGATGSGKSEFLRSLILSLAMTHHPYDVNFALIDYKGGAAFEELDQLPHVVGVITNIEENVGYATRVIESLIGEMRTRERILKDAYNKLELKRPHIKDYRNLPVKRPLPRLVIIFDEFAEFKERHPEEADDLISIIRKGRALGIHLILATQNPMFALTPQVQQNARFRIALSVNSPDTSREIIDIADAYNLPPGRGYFKVSSPKLFQAAFSGDAYMGEEKTEAKAIIQQIKYFFGKIELSKPPVAWHAPLPERITLTDLIDDLKINTSWNTDRWVEDENPAFSNTLGIFDYPAKQLQDLFEFGKSGSGHLIIVGSPSAGKTTALLTIATSLALFNSPNQINFYALDCGNQNSLAVLKNFPHVAKIGGVSSINDKDQVSALFNLLEQKIAHKKSSEIKTKTYLLIDNYKYTIDDFFPDFNSHLSHILTSGPSVGIHVVITLSNSQDLAILSDKIPEIIALRQSSIEEYSSVLDRRVPKHLLYTQIGEPKRPGWGLLNSDPVLEIQLALPGNGANIENYEVDVKTISKKMLTAWHGDRPDDIPVLPDYIYSEDLVRLYFAQIENIGQSSELEMPLGLKLDGLAPIGLSLDSDGPVFYIGSTDDKKGKTSLLLTWMFNIAKQYKKNLVSFSIVAYHNKKFGNLKNFSHVRDFISSTDLMEKYMDDIEVDIETKSKKMDSLFNKDPSKFDERVILKKFGYHVIVIDDYYMFSKADHAGFTDRLAQVIEKGHRVGYRLIVAERAGLMTTLYNDDIFGLVQNYRCGVMLGGSANTELFTDVQLPYQLATSNLIPGRGYLGNRGELYLFQAATYLPKNGKKEEI